MKADTLLKIQAYLDGELTQVDAEEVRQRIEMDPEARAVLSELEGLKRMLGTGEPVRSTPMPRAAYWDGIWVQIQSQRSEATEDAGLLSRWGRAILRYLVPVGAMAGICALALFHLLPRAEEGPVLAVGHEVEMPIENMSSFTFRSESQMMTVVWVNSEWDTGEDAPN